MWAFPSSLPRPPPKQGAQVFAQHPWCRCVCPARRSLYRIKVWVEAHDLSGALSTLAARASHTPPRGGPAGPGPERDTRHYTVHLYTLQLYFNLYLCVRLSIERVSALAAPSFSISSSDLTTRTRNAPARSRRSTTRAARPRGRRGLGRGAPPPPPRAHRVRVPPSAAAGRALHPSPTSARVQTVARPSGIAPAPRLAPSPTISVRSRVELEDGTRSPTRGAAA